MTQFTEPTRLFDYHSRPVRQFVSKTVGDDPAPDPREAAVALFYAVRDNINYEIFGTDISDHGLRASTVLADGRGFCLHKSVLYVAAARAMGIPARLLSPDPPVKLVV